MQKSIALFCALAALQTTQTQALPSFSDFTREAYRLQQESFNSGLSPIIGENLISVLLTDLINIVYSPSWASVAAVFVDLSAFFMMPMLGGFVNSSVFANYIDDPLTYQHAGLDKDLLYGSSMILMKDAIYSATGRPDFFDIPATL